MWEEYTCQLPDEVRKYCAETLNETEESRRNGLKEMRKWAEENPRLHVRTDEKFILPFLRCCKFDIDKTKEKLKNFQIIRRDRTEWFANRDPYLPEIGEMARLGSFTVLKRLHENQLVVIMRPTVRDPNSQKFDDMLKFTSMMTDIAVMENELAQIYGIILIVDTKDISFSHLRELTISRIRHMAQSWMCYHSSPKKIELVNAPMSVNMFIKVVKSFLSQKMKSRFHTSYNAVLTDVIDKSILPKDYGGDGETMAELGDYYIEKLKSYADWFAEDEKHKAE